tara:strand:- start:93 stop:449 length:357 start_codon:yes stop_codon:yes gene_type:complete
MEFLQLAEQQLEILKLKTTIDLKIDHLIYLIKDKQYNSSTIRSAKNFLSLIGPNLNLSDYPDIPIENLSDKDLQTIKQELIQDTNKLQELYTKDDTDKEGRKPITPLKSLRVLIQDLN